MKLTSFIKLAFINPNLEIMKALLRMYLLGLMLVLASCSEDDSVPSNSLAGDNGFEFDQTAYVTDMIYVTDTNEIILSSRDFRNGNTVAINAATFSTLNGELSERTYTVDNDLIRCNAVIEGVWNDGAVEDGDVILGADISQTGFMRIVHFDALDQQIKVIFEFTRNDGKLVSGTYSGNFTPLSLN